MIRVNVPNSFERCPQFPEFMKNGMGDFYTRIGDRYFKVQYFTARSTREPSLKPRHVYGREPQWKRGDPPLIMIKEGKQGPWVDDNPTRNYNSMENRFHWTIKHIDRNGSCRKLRRFLFDNGIEATLMEEVL